MMYTRHVSLTLHVEGFVFEIETMMSDIQYYAFVHTSKVSFFIGSVNDMCGYSWGFLLFKIVKPTMLNLKED